MAASPKIIKEDLVKIQNIAKKRDKDISNFEAVFFVEFFVAEDYEEAENMVKSNARCDLAVWPKNLRRLGYNSRNEYNYSNIIPDEKTENYIHQFSKMIPIQAVRGTAIYSTPKVA